MSKFKGLERITALRGDCMVSDEEGEYVNYEDVKAYPEMIEALQELIILVEDHRNGQYKFDSLSLQPAKAALTKAGVL